MTSTLYVQTVVHGLGYRLPQPRPDQQRIDLKPSDPGVHPDAHSRLSRQCALILAAFQAAPDHELTNVQLAEIAIRYSARLHDIKRAGIAIFRKVSVDHATGVVRYRMEVMP